MEELKGNVTLMFFFATWCPHCKQSLPKLPDIVERHAGRPVKLVAVTNNTRNQTTETATVFVKDPQWRIDYPTAVDDRGRTSRAMAATGVPSMVLVDMAGNIRWVGHPNYLTDQMIETLLTEGGA